jgi:transaldolase
VDKALEEIGNTEIQGKIAIDNARIAYSRFREIFSSERWKKLATAAARVQRPLWASTSSKNPAYPDTLYVDNLIGPDTVNTLPPATLDDFLDHGKVATTVETDVDGARMRMAEVAELGIDLDAITNKVLDDGVKSFAKSFDALLGSITEKQEKLLWDWQQTSAGFGPRP